MGDQDLKIGFIGGGNMAHAIVGGLLRAGHSPAAISVSEPGMKQRESMARLDPSLRIIDSNEQIAAASTVLMLAVKPQVVPVVLAAIAGAHRPAGQLLVSIAAGVTLESITRALGAAVAVRVMPNQPALIGEGMSVLVAGPGVSDAQRAQAAYIAGSTGRAIWIADESLMDAVTAVSGSGPAYVYLLMEMMEDAAVELGLPRDVARVMVRQTALGSARVASDPEQDVVALRASVTSPGGTTAAALAVMEQAGIRDILRRALTAARDRGTELGRGSS